MNEYPLKIETITEFEGFSVMGYYSKGHHNKELFINEVMKDYEYKSDKGKVIHTNIKLSPSPTGGMMINYKKNICKGSFIATVINF